jgi:hypothetical protein
MPNLDLKRLLLEKADEAEASVKKALEDYRSAREKWKNSEMP